MTKVRVRASAENVKNALEDRGDFVLAPPGFYVMKVVEASTGYSKDKDGEEDKERPRVEVVLDYVAEGKERKELAANYGRIWHYVSFSQESGDTRANFVRAFWPDQVVPGQELDFEFDTDDLIERECLVRVKHEVDKLKTAENKASNDPKIKNQTAKRARISRFFTFEDDAFDEAESATDAYASAEDTNPFDEGAAAAEPAADEEPLLTEEDLTAMTLKELGAVAKEFDLVPDELVVRGADKKVDSDATKTAVIAAILEAQNGEDGVDDSPF